MLFISDAVTALTGWLPQDFLEGRVNFTQLTLPEEVDRPWAEVSTAIQEHRPTSWSLACGPRRATALGVGSDRPVAGDDGQVLWIDGVIMDMTAFKERNAEFESIVRAINRALAVVEFDMQGHVLHANDNFLNLMGYVTSREIVGQHHRMFCEPAYVQTEAYVQFWEQLRSGQLDGGEYLRLARTGGASGSRPPTTPFLTRRASPSRSSSLRPTYPSAAPWSKSCTAKERAEQAAAARSTFRPT